MYCPNCGTFLEDSAAFCTQCGERIDGAQQQQQAQQQQAQQQPTYEGTVYTPQQQPQPGPSSTVYLVFSILVTVLCFLPLGIPGIVYATKIDRMKQEGRMQEAQKAATTSLIFIILSAVVGVFFCFFVFFFAGLYNALLY